MNNLNLIKPQDLQSVEHWSKQKGSIPEIWRERVAWYRRYTEGKEIARIKSESGIEQIKESRQLSREQEKRQKLLDFINLVASNGGNTTRAAQIVGKYKNESSAAAAGYYMMKEARKMGLYRVYLEKKGFDMGKMLDVATEKMLKSKKPDWWDRVMKMAGYEDFISKKSEKATNVNINVFSEHEKLANEYIIDGEVEEIE